ncbi:unnamed protein product [Blepharisma stoltei]|uniref:DNA replication complex GINS protein SLD5 n=1 Tax=Blepharisma stoltei TaxID=1481888 RepID=A0AAU9K6E9_9CILI|nr:unnamed protein product [Blepharisma stoltei]
MGLAEEVLELEAAVRREKACPEILMYESDLIESLIGQVESREKALRIDPITPEEQFRGLLYQMDLDRVKYLLSSYLRSRLVKIQAYALWVVRQDDVNFLSPQEIDFLTKYYSIKTNHFKKTFLLGLPNDLRSLESRKGQRVIEVSPQLDKHVFIKVIDDVGRVQTENSADIYLEKGDIFFIPYNLVKPLITEERKIDLV